MQSIPYLNTCERPLSLGNYAILYLNTWGTSAHRGGGGRVAHLYTTYNAFETQVKYCEQLKNAHNCNWSARLFGQLIISSTPKSGLLLMLGQIFADRFLLWRNIRGTFKKTSKIEPIVADMFSEF